MRARPRRGAALMTLIELPSNRQSFCLLSHLFVISQTCKIKPTVVDAQRSTVDTHILYSELTHTHTAYGMSISRISLSSLATHSFHLPRHAFELSPTQIYRHLALDAVAIRDPLT